MELFKRFIVSFLHFQGDFRSSDRAEFIILIFGEKGKVAFISYLEGN